MKNTINLTHVFVKGLLSVYLIALSSMLFASSDAEVITTIILINRQAELVDVSSDGEILKRHVAVPDYFTSGRSHSNSLKRSLNLIKDYGSIDYMLPESSSLCSQTLQSYILKEAKSRLTCKHAISPSIQKGKKVFNNISKDLGVIPTLAFGMVKPNIKEHRNLIRNVIKEEKIAFADIFFPSIDLVFSYNRQHNINNERFHRGVFSDT